MKKALIIFVKNLKLGKVKTRLAKSIGDEKAYLAYQYMVNYTLDIARGVDCDKYVYYSDHIEEINGPRDNGFFTGLQEGLDLGERMSNAFHRLIDEGYEQVAIIGSDNLEITSTLINDAYGQLQSSDLVIGPAKDGGYYLLAANNHYPCLFKNISWSTNAVLQHTLTICNEEKINFHLLPVLSDIDTEEDWLNFLHSPSGRNLAI